MQPGTVQLQGLCSFLSAQLETKQQRLQRTGSPASPGAAEDCSWRRRAQILFWRTKRIQMSTWADERHSMSKKKKVGPVLFHKRPMLSWTKKERTVVESQDWHLGTFEASGPAPCFTEQDAKVQGGRVTLKGCKSYSLYLCSLVPRLTF